ncbi:MAG: HAD family phosphatase [Saprospiraceae bacterium]|nr:HAD family phosphatase [Saprospiraceae bacterium]
MIKNIIFDFGNVLLNLDENATMDALTSILDSSKCLDLDKMVFFPFEKGLISEEAFFHRLQSRSKIILQGDIYYAAWNAMLLDFPEKRIQMLKALRNQYKIFLLSNTNITHLRKVKRNFEKEIGLLEFDKLLFDKAYFSHEIGMRKPDLEIYQYIVEDMKLIPSECLYIDDKIENTVAAGNFGMHVHHLQPAQEISEIIQDLIKNVN